MWVGIAVLGLGARGHHAARPRCPSTAARRAPVAAARARRAPPRGTRRPRAGVRGRRRWSRVASRPGASSTCAVISTSGSSSASARTWSARAWPRSPAWPAGPAVGVARDPAGRRARRGARRRRHHARGAHRRAPRWASIGLALACVGITVVWPLLLADVNNEARHPALAIGGVTAAGYLGMVAGPPIVGVLSGVVRPLHRAARARGGRAVRRGHAGTRPPPDQAVDLTTSVPLDSADADLVTGAVGPSSGDGDRVDRTWSRGGGDGGEWAAHRRPRRRSTTRARRDRPRFRARWCFTSRVSWTAW